MNRNLKTAATLAAMGAAALLSGCAFVPMTVHSHYMPPANVAKVPGADKVLVDVVVKNEKKHKNEISVTKDGYGFKMAGVYMNVSKDFKTAIDRALVARGFHVGKNGSVAVDVTVKKFFLTEQVHFASEGHTGNLLWLITVRNNNGKVIYSTKVSVAGLHHHKGFSFTSVGRSASANALLDLGVTKLMDDKLFIKALLKNDL
jgi:uncharacterized lipoprotein YajG